jgi:pimeloyl-ACP methyl ester carboxylesterase
LGWLPVSGLILRFMSWLGGFKLPCSPEQDIKNVVCPVLVLQSEEDDLTPQESGHRLKLANPKCVQLIKTPHSKHVQLAYEQPETYSIIVREFITSCFSKPEPDALTTIK